MSVAPLTILVTGGAGFIGSALVRQLVGETSHLVVNIDKLTYAGNLESLGNAESVYLSDDVPASPRDGAAKEQK